MKIILNKQIRSISSDLTKQMRLLLKQHGLKPKESLLMQFDYKIYIALGGKKEKYKI